jgi:hypothetical protein
MHKSFQQWSKHVVHLLLLPPRCSAARQDTAQADPAVRPSLHVDARSESHHQSADIARTSLQFLFLVCILFFFFIFINALIQRDTLLSAVPVIRQSRMQFQLVPTNTLRQTRISLSLAGSPPHHLHPRQQHRPGPQA